MADYKPPRRTEAEWFHSHLQSRGHEIRIIRRFGMSGQSQISTLGLRGTTADHDPYYAFTNEIDVQAGDVVTRKELLDTRWRVRRIEEVRDNGRPIYKRAYLDMVPPVS